MILNTRMTFVFMAFVLLAMAGSVLAGSRRQELADHLSYVQTRFAVACPRSPDASSALVARELVSNLNSIIRDSSRDLSRVSQALAHPEEAARPKARLLVDAEIQKFREDVRLAVRGAGGSARQEQQSVAGAMRVLQAAESLRPDREREETARLARLLVQRGREEMMGLIDIHRSAVSLESKVRNCWINGEGLGEAMVPGISQPGVVAGAASPSGSKSSPNQSAR